MQSLWRNLVIGTFILVVLFIASMSAVYFMQDWIVVDLGYRHFASIFGLPAAAAASLAIVLITRAVSGHMEVEFFTLKFKGAASEAIMWLVCFLGITFAIEKTWDLKYDPPSQAAAQSELSRSPY